MPLGSILVRLTMDTATFETDSKRAEKRLKDMEKAAVTAGKAIGAGLLVGATALTAMTVQAINFADEIDEMSMRLGISTETLSGWGYAAKLSGTSLDSLTNAIPKLSKNLAAAMDEGSRAGELFKTLGIDVKDAAGNLRDVEDVLPEIADRFKALDNDTTEAALAMELFGRSGAELLEFLNRGSDGITELTDRAAELGIVISSETAASAAEFNDKLDDLRAVTMSYGLLLAEELLPALTELVEWFTKSAQEGEGLRRSMELLGDVSQFLVGELEKADEVGESFRQTVGFIRVAVDSLRDGLSDLLSLDLKGFIGNLLDAQKGASGALIAGFSPFDTPEVPKAPGQRNVRGGSNRTETGGRNRFFGVDLEDRVNRFFRGEAEAGTKAKTQISEAEKAMQRLNDAADSLAESQRERIALYGLEGEEVKVRYDIEHGALQGIDEAKAKQLLMNAQHIDLLDEAVEMEQIWADIAKDHADFAEDRTRAFEDTNAAILEQITLLGMTRDEQEIYNNLAWAGVEADSERGQIIIENTRRLQAMSDVMSDQIELMDTIRGAGADFLSDWLSGSKSLKDSFLGALDSIHERILQMIAENLMERLLGKQGDPGGGAGGDWLGTLVGAFFGGGMASGGTARANTLYEVNERGFEMATVGGRDYMLTGSQPVQITPNHRLGGQGMTQQVINLTVQGRVDRRSENRIAQEIGTRTRVALARR